MAGLESEKVRAKIDQVFQELTDLLSKELSTNVNPLGKRYVTFPVDGVEYLLSIRRSAQEGKKEEQKAAGPVRTGRRRRRQRE